MQLGGAAYACRVAGAVEEPRGCVARQRCSIGVCAQGLACAVSCTGDFVAAPCKEPIPLDAFVRERAGCAAGRAAGLAGRSKAFVREELFCTKARCVVAVVGQGLQAAAAAFFYAEELVLGAPAVAGGESPFQTRPWHS